MAHQCIDERPLHSHPGRVNSHCRLSSRRPTSASPNATEKTSRSRPDGSHLCLRKRIITGLIGTLPLIFPDHSGALQFTEVSAAAGIIHQFDQDPANLIRTVDPADQEYGHMTGGAVAEDFDGDGWVDLFVLRGGLQPNLLYRNQRDGTFAEEAALRGADQTGRHSAVCGADYDSDGDVDLFISVVDGPHLLLTNDGSGYFTASPDVIPSIAERPSSPSWADIDGDGLLDLALGAWADGEKDALRIYRNEGNGKFAQFQIIPTVWNFVPHFADLNGDGHVDLVAVADFLATRYFLNNGRGVFLPAGSSDIQNGMGVATADLDDDGDLDLFMTAIQHRDPASNTTDTNGNRLLLNNGHGEFSDATTQSGVRAGYWGWGALFGDLDNDADQDLFHVNGFNPFFNFSTDFITTPAVLFENDGAMNFSEVAASSGDAGDLGQGRCVVSLDYDNDGDLDLFMVNNNEVQPGPDSITFETTPGKLVLLRNDTPATGNWLKVRIEGRAPYNAHGMGARIQLELSGKTQLREINASSNFNGHGPYRIAHFGAGDATLVDALQVTFPNGDAVRHERVPANQEVIIATPRGIPGGRKVELGASLTFEMPADAIPPGAEVVWAHEASDYPNPAEVTFDTPGPTMVTARVFSDPTRTTLVREEAFRIKVIDPAGGERSIARIWNDLALEAIRIDFPNPGVHARNLFHLSVAMWDAWAAYDSTAVGYLHREFVDSADRDADRREAISYAAYRVLSSRYDKAVHASASQLLLDFQMEDLGYPVSVTTTEGSGPAALGNRIGATIIAWGASDGSLEEDIYHDPAYRPVNRPLVLAESGATLDDPNRWQPLQFERALSQNGLFTLRTQIYAGSQWGEVRPFALQPQSPTYLDPGTPPQLGGFDDEAYRQQAVEVVRYSSWLDPDDRILIDISPRSRGRNTLGENDGTGHGSDPNPASGEPYPEQWVTRADYGRVIAEYWADGPDSETPPGHWNNLANEISEHPGLTRQFRGTSPVLAPLEWDVKLYFALNAALHDAAVAAWACKRYYDYVRPISSIRYLSGLGTLPETPGLVEKITAASSAPGERHAHLVTDGAKLGDTAIFAWGGEPEDPESEATGSAWILGEDWLPYQRATFVTPAFAGYVSGHSTFSRAAAEVLAAFTGTPYFPGGLGTHHVPAGTLEFEFGPSTDVTLQWATYYDAADEAGLSRLYGGIHFPVDDGPGRLMGSTAGIQAMQLAEKYFDGSILSIPVGVSLVNGPDGLKLHARVVRGLSYQLQTSNDLINWENQSFLHRTLDSRLVLPIDPTLPASFFRLRR